MFSLSGNRPIIKIRHDKSVRATAGFVLAQFTLLATALMAFLGVAIYYGQIGLVQNELQKTANMVALVGAAALYDGPTQGAPVASPSQADTAARSAFTRAVGASAMLQGMNAQLTGLSVSGNQVDFSAQGQINTPFFNLIGVSQVQVRVTARAAAAKEVVLNIGPLNSANPFRSITLRQPLLDGPGPDLHLAPVSMGGYIPEVCAGSADCYPVSGAAKPVGGGSVSDRTLNGQNARLLYGEQYIDLGANGPGYAAYVKKANQIKLTDDGFDDEMIGGARYLFLTPSANASFGVLEVFHHSVLCDSLCTYPPGFAPMS